MQEDVGLKVTDEDQCQRPRVGPPDGAGVHGPGEVIRQQAQRAARRDVLGGHVEGEDDRARTQMHLHGYGRPDHRADERNDLLGERAQDHARIGGRIGGRERRRPLRNLHVMRAHGRGEERLLGREVPEDGCRRHSEHDGDVRQGRALEPPLGEAAPGGLEDLVAGDARRTAHDR